MSGKAQSPKQHHIVPKWYLKGFTDPDSGFIYVYDKITKEFRRQKPNQIMRINKYYRQEWAPEGIDPNILEKLAGEMIEPKAKEAFKRLLTMPSDFTSEETAIILIYLEFQRIRVPRQARTARQLIESAVLTQADPDFIEAYMKGQIAISESARFQYMRQVSGKIVSYFTRMKWHIEKASRGSSFITTDSPVSFFNKEFLPPSEAGLGLAGTMVLFPLCSELMLIMRHPAHGPEISPKMLLPEPEKRDTGIEINFYPEPIVEDVVNQCNWTLVELSDRIVAGNSKEILEKCIVAVPNTNNA